MLKKIIIGVIVLGVIVLAGWKLFFSKSDISSALEKKTSDLTCYHMELTMDMENGDNTRNYFVTTDYQKTDDGENFRVSIKDQNISQEQIIIKNKDGVFVLTPTLNQVYKFNSGWPTNSPKPYLYQSILSGFETKHDIKKVDDGYILSTNPTYKNNPTWIKQDTKLTSDLAPQYINIYGANNEALVKINFSKVDFSPKFEEGYFEVKNNMDTSRSNLTENTSKGNQEFPMYPTGANISATMKEETTSTIDGSEVVILVYEGEDAFTVVQSIIEPSKEMVVSEIDGTLESVLTGVAYSKNNYLIYVENNIKYSIYSKALTISEKIEVAEGMEYSIMK